MTRKIFLIIPATISLIALCACSGNSRDRRISHAMREYVQPALSAAESFDYIGISNNRDTVYMGDTRPCATVLYNVHHDATGTSTRHCDIVIFSNDYKVILNVTPCDFDPIEYAGDKVRQEFRKALQELIKR